MKDDDLLRDLGRVAREQAVADEEEFSAPRWDALCAGTLAAEEEEELRAEAMSSSAGRRAWEVFRPPDEGFRRRVVQRLQESRAERGGTGREASVGGAGLRCSSTPSSSCSSSSPSS